MSHEATELYLYITNDSNLYRQMMVPIQKNYMLKRKKGIFDKERAVTGFMYLAEEGARHYIKEFGSPGDNIATMFPKSVRLEVARELTDRFIAEADLGNYDYLLEKKNPGVGGFDYKTVDTRTEQGLMEAERLKAAGWKVIQTGFNTIQLEKPKTNPQTYRNTGEADQEYGIETFDKIVQQLNRAGFKGATHREFDKYQGPYLLIPKIGRFWIKDIFYRGTISKADLARSYTSAKLWDAEGNEVSPNIGDYFMSPKNKVLEGYRLELIKQDGKKVSKNSPMIKDLPDITQVMNTFQYEKGTPVTEVIEMYNEKDVENEEILATIQIFVTDGKVDASELITYCREAVHKNPRRSLTADRVAEIAESFVNGNISWVREQIAGNLENFINVQAYIAQNFPDSSESFQRLMVKENPRRASVGRMSPMWGGASFPAAIQEYSTGKWGVVGSVPEPLYKKIFGSKEEVIGALTNLGYTSTDGMNFRETRSNPARKYDWTGKGKDLPEEIFESLNEAYPVDDNTPMAFKTESDGAIGIWYGEPVIKGGYRTSQYHPLGKAYAAEPDDRIFAAIQKLIPKQNPLRLLYQVNPNYWDVPKLIQDLKAMGVKFKVIERGRLRTDIIPATEADYHRIWAIHYDSGRDYRRPELIAEDIIKTHKRANPQGRPKVDHSNWKIMISSAPPYYTPDGFVLFHDEHGNRNKARMEDFRDITSAEDRIHGQHRFEVRNVRGKTAPKRKFVDKRYNNPHYHDKVSIKGVVYYIDCDNLRLVDAHTRTKAINFDSKLEMQEYLSTGGIAAFPMRKGGQKALKKELTKKFGAERWVKCTHCGSSFTIRFHGRGPRAKRYMKNCPDCGGLIEVRG